MIEEGVEGCSRMSKRWALGSNGKMEGRMRTCKKSRFIRSRIFPLMPPDVMLAKHRSLTTICISAPCAIISSIEAIWFATPYDARRSRGG